MRPSLQSKRPFGRHGGPRPRLIAATAGALAAGALALALGTGAAGAQRGSHAARKAHKVRAHHRSRASIPAPAGEGSEASQAAPSARPLGAASSGDAGHALFRLDANTYFDRYSNNAAFIQAHVDVVKAYPPYGDRYVQYGK